MASARPAEAQKGGAMNAPYPDHLSPQQLEQRFNLLVADVREYAIFLVGPHGHLLHRSGCGDGWCSGDAPVRCRGNWGR
jgi:hypothetical protein